MKEIKLNKPAAEAARIKDFLVKSDKFLNHTGLISEGHYCLGFDPGYSFSTGSYGSYFIPAYVMDAIIKVFEE